MERKHIPDSVRQKSVDVPAEIIYIIICMVLTVVGNARLREIICHFFARVGAAGK